MSKPTLLIAEDDFLILEGSLCPLLTPHFEIVAAVMDGLEAVAAAEKHRPEIVLLDVSLPGLRGFEVARRVLANQPNCTLLFVSNYGDRAYLEAAREMGAKGWVLKNRVASELLPAIRLARAGEFYQRC